MRKTLQYHLSSDKVFMHKSSQAKVIPQANKKAKKGGISLFKSWLKTMHKTEQKTVITAIGVSFFMNKNLLQQILFKSKTFSIALTVKFKKCPAISA